jgi:hypothetical protein
MGKLGVGGVTVVALVFAALLPAGEASAQDFGQTWIDRITHELEQERGPLQPKPFNWTADVGINYAFDNNVFLVQKDKESDSIIIPFIQAGFTYGEPRFDIEASLLANYKFYASEDADDDEERVYLRARQTSSRWNFEISEIFQHVSDPSGLLFIDRVSRVVSNTVPKAAFDIGRSWGLETAANIQIVRFEDRTFSIAQENNNFSVDLNLVYRTPWAWDAVAQFGYYNIAYLAGQTSGGAPDVFGYYYRVGFRGDLVQRLTVEALIGYTTVETDFFVSTGNDIEEGTLSAVINLRYEATENLNFFLDYARLYAFQGFGDPFQLLNTLTIYGKYQATESVAFSARAQYDFSESALHVRRSYYALGLNANIKLTAQWIADIGVTYRGGKSENTTTNQDLSFNNFILSVGLAFGF